MPLTFRCHQFENILLVVDLHTKFEVCSLSGSRDIEGGPDLFNLLRGSFLYFLGSNDVFDFTWKPTRAMHACCVSQNTVKICFIKE